MMNYNKGLQIFIVDDDPFYRELFGQYLRNYGFSRIKMFENGQQCLNQLTDSPDIILLNHQMTPIDGLETLKKIKRFDPNIFLIFVSGQRNTKVAMNALEYGAVEYIVKGDDGEEDRIACIMDEILEMKATLQKNKSGWLRRVINAFS